MKKNQKQEKKITKIQKKYIKQKKIEKKKCNQVGIDQHINVIYSY